ncbi:methyltransferase domain-containing protein [Candidatus Woesearchaeota archaeon]|nr:methyltransferase domain-containing protein [Candidatus Woesearchaeota archaeon]
MEPNDSQQQEIKTQAGKLLALIAGYSGFRTIEIGIRTGLIDKLAKHPNGISTKQLAAAASLDPFYVEVWCRSAYGAEVLDVDQNGAYRLSSQMQMLLLDADSPFYTGGVFIVLSQPEVFEQFHKNFASGERTWWDKCGQEFIKGVGNTGKAFNNRLIPGGLNKVPGLSERLKGGANVLELACGTGNALAKFMKNYPNTTLSGLDGDEFSLKLAAEHLKGAGLDSKVSLIRSTLEDFNSENKFDLITINISMHECRDIEKVAANVFNALKPGGFFVVSDFPFPETPEGLRSTPGRIMGGIQFFEALIGDQLLPTRAFTELLGRHNFKNVGSFDLTPVHVIIHGQK